MIHNEQLLGSRLPYSLQSVHELLIYPFQILINLLSKSKGASLCVQETS